MTRISFLGRRGIEISIECAIFFLGIGALAFVWYAYADYPLGTELIRYEFEEGTGAIVNTGTGSTTYNTSFSGASDYTSTAYIGNYGGTFADTGDYVDIGWGNGVNPLTSNFSVSMWVNKTNTCLTGDDDHILGVSGAAANTRWYIRCRVNVWAFRVAGQAAVASDVTVTTDGSTWYHIALVADGSTARFYVDGVAKGTSTITSFVIGRDFYIGNLNDGGDLSEGAGAIIDDFALYTRTLTPTEVLEIYNAKATPGAPTGFSATGFSGEAALSWTAPSGNFPAVSDYAVLYKQSASGSYSTFSDGVSTTTSATVTGLSNGTVYNFKVAAINENGSGTLTSAVNATPAVVMTYSGGTPDNNTSTGQTLFDVQISSTFASGTSFAFNLYSSTGVTISSSTGTTRTGDYNLANLTQETDDQNLALAANTSSVTYVPSSGTLYVIHNDSGSIDEITLAGVLVRTITCSTCGDTEGIEWVSSAGTDHTFMISTEGTSKLFQVTIGSATSAVDATNDYALGLGDQSNLGVEGVAYDSVNDLYYAVKEKTALAMYSIDISGPTVTEICDAPTLFSGEATDLSDIDYQTTTGYAYVLSHESDKVMAVDISDPNSCSIVNQRAIGQTQTEGVTWDSTGDYLYAIGEADQLSVWRTNNYTSQVFLMIPTRTLSL
jgi:uncharacterized protein YjiK